MEHQDPVAVVFDPAPLRRLGEVADDALARLMIDQCMDTIAQRVRDAEAAWRAGDLAAVALQAHTLKASAGIVGARRVVELTQRLQQAANGRDAAAAARLLGDLAVARDLTLEALARAREALAQ